MTEFELHLNDLLVDTFNFIMKYEETSLKSLPTPVTVSEAHIIEAISKKGGSTTVSDIALALGVAAPTVTVAVKKLENKGLVTKTPCEKDGRSYIIGLTEQGRKADRGHSIFHKRMVRNIERDFSGQEREALLTAIKKLNLFFSKKVTGGE